MQVLLPVAVLLGTLVQCFGQHALHYPYTWVCEEGKCVKQTANNSSLLQSLNVCMLRCSLHAALWPRPQQISIYQQVVPINSNSISIYSQPLNSQQGENEKMSQMVREVGKRFTDLIVKEDKSGSGEARTLRYSLEVVLLIEHPEVAAVTQDTDESYNLSLSQAQDGRVNVKITGPTYFGVRHGIETLSQLIVYDYISGGLVVPREVEIKDWPAYKYRGVLLDTARSYITLPVLRRVIDTMAANKLNTFHWHITDSHSFPLQTRTYPQMMQYGAYSPDKIYTEQDVRDLVEFARVRGVRIVPEFDAPAHVGEGWQWADDQQATVCFKKEPWQDFCVEPPCGQINPVSNFAYQILQGIYSDVERLFDSDLFHMGGDEVKISCWNSSQVITDWMTQNGLATNEDGFHQLWNQFQERALEKLDSVSKQKHPIVLWTSSLTEKGRVDKFLNKSRYIIQIWTTGKDEIIAELVNKGFQVIFSNYDTLYFDCGFGAWVGEGNNWCSPYIGWQKIYENRPMKILQQLGVNVENEQVKKQVLGQEATLWTEQADSHVVEQRLWPRGAAMAERLWSDPAEDWKAAEQRFLYHRERLVARGVAADTIEPLWCLQNQGHCYL